MTKRNKAETGTVSWVDLTTPDLQKARDFYGALLGWSFIGQGDPKTGYYTTAELDGQRIAGLMQQRDDAKEPTGWSIYFATNDADATQRKVSDAGGKVLMPAMDIQEQGRMAMFADPTGVVFGIWQAKQHPGAELVNEPGTMVWHEEQTRDAKKAADFYGRVFGTEPKRIEDPSMEYWTLQRGSEMVGGVMQMNGQLPKETRPHWHVYFDVDDVDAAVKIVEERGGKVVSPPADTPYGRMSSVIDPFGASFSLIRPMPPQSS